jgi:hypothetical protein
VLPAEGRISGEITALQSLFCWGLRERSANPVEPGAPPAPRVKDPLVTVQPEKSASKP